MPALHINSIQSNNLESGSDNNTWNRVSGYALSRDPEILKNFSDGVIAAEIINFECPSLFSPSDLEIVRHEAREHEYASHVWLYLSLTALKQLCIFITDSIYFGFQSGDRSSIIAFFTTLFKQIEIFKRACEKLNAMSVELVAENYLLLTAASTFKGIVLQAHSLLAWSQSKTVLEISNLSELSRKCEIRHFFYPLIVEVTDVHMPITHSNKAAHKSAYVVFESHTIAETARDLHQGRLMNSGCVDLKLVSMDELYRQLYNRGPAPPAAGDWIRNESIESMFAELSDISNLTLEACHRRIEALTRVSEDMITDFISGRSFSDNPDIDFVALAGLSSYADPKGALNGPVRERNGVYRLECKDRHSEVVCRDGRFGVFRERSASCCSPRGATNSAKFHINGESRDEHCKSSNLRSKTDVWLNSEDKALCNICNCTESDLRQYLESAVLHATTLFLSSENNTTPLCQDLLSRAEAFFEHFMSYLTLLPWEYGANLGTTEIFRLNDLCHATAIFMYQISKVLFEKESTIGYLCRRICETVGKFKFFSASERYGIVSLLKGGKTEKCQLYGHPDARMFAEIYHFLRSTPQMQLQESILLLASRHRQCVTGISAQAHQATLESFAVNESRKYIRSPSPSNCVTAGGLAAAPDFEVSRNNARRMRSLAIEIGILPSQAGKVDLWDSM